MQRYSTVFLDLDNTLFDFHVAEHLALQQVMERFRIPFTEENERIYVEENRALWQKFDRGEVTQQQVGIGRFRGLLSRLKLDESRAEAMNDDYEVTLGKFGILLPGAEALCRRLSGSCNLYILTNGMSRSQRGRLSGSTIQPYIKDIFISQELGCQKPMKEYFDRVMGDLGLSQEQLKQTVMVGDSLSSDILGGIRAGLDTIWYHPGRGNQPPDDMKPTWEARTLEQIGDIILGK